jgi:hypothetical protein
MQASRSDDVDRLHQVKVGNNVVGRAFCNLLGLVWRRIKTGEPVVQRRHSESLMNGDGGQGGFNPGRGGFNNGRGGYHARGGYVNGHGANGARGRLNQGGGRGGQGYGGGRGFQGNNANSGFCRNFVHGEASSTAGMNNVAGFREENWGGSWNSNFYINTRFGYGANQQRWNNGNNSGTGNGYQNRFRANGDGAAARSAIDADLLQQTVQAVIAAVMVAQKTPEPIGGTVMNNAAGTDVSSAAQGQPVVISVKLRHQLRFNNN